MRRRALPLVLACAAAIVLSFRPIYEPDLWWHLAQGREDAAGRLVRTNVFSFTWPEYRQQYTPWLYDTAIYGAWQAAGGAGVQVFQAACIAAALLMLFAACRERAPAWSAASVLVLAAVVIEPRAIPRPHLVSFAGMAACALLIERACAQRSVRPLYWTVPIVAVWSNLHVEVVFGVALVGLLAAAEWLRPAALSRHDAVRAFLIAAACGLAVLANPYGWGVLAYLYENISVPRLLAIAELRPPYLPAYRAFYAWIVFVAIALLSCGRGLRLRDVALAVVFGALGARYLRLTPLVLFATAPLLAGRLAALTTRGIAAPAIVVTMLAASFTLLRIPVRLLATTMSVGEAAVEPPQFFSRGAVDFIRREGLEGPVFNSHNLGGYLAWAGYPRVRVFQDSRLQAYPPDHFRSIMAASESQDTWDALVAGVDWAVLSVPRPNQLSGAGRFPEPEWAIVYADDAMEIVVRRAGRYGRLAERAGETAGEKK